MIHTPEAIRTALKAFLAERNDVVAAWEGGAAATGYLDEYSDLDLEIVLGTGTPDELFQVLDAYFEQQYGILKRFRMPEPAWHGMSQTFYLLKDTPPLFYCDIAVVMADNPRKFTEPDRHGNSVIWFDKTGVFKATETPPEEARQLAERLFHLATDFDWLSLIELRKALARQNWIAAHLNYLQFLNRNLVILLNLRYRPCKADFGIRYAEREFPEEVTAKLEDLLRVTDVQDIARRLPQAQKWFEELKEELTPDFQSKGGQP